MFTFNGPCVVTWNLKNWMKLPDGIIENVFKQLIDMNVLCLKIDNDNEILLNEKHYKMFMELGRNNIGIEWNVASENISMDGMKRVYQISNYVNFTVSEATDSEKMIKLLR